MLIVIGKREAAFLLKTIKRMLYLGYVLLRYVLFNNLEVSFNFHLTVLQLNVLDFKYFSRILKNIDIPGSFISRENLANTVFF